MKVAVVATLSNGYDLDYIWKQVDRGPVKDAAGYYLQASESGGEPPAGGRKGADVYAALLAAAYAARVFGEQHEEATPVTAVGILVPAS